MEKSKTKTKEDFRDELSQAIEECARKVIAKYYGSSDNFDVIANLRMNELEIYQNRIVVADEKLEDENKEISLSEARKLAKDFEIGEECMERICF